jgi:hypothetical protein
MKKVLLIGILALLVCVSGVFAAENNHPDGWGIGVGFHGGYGGAGLYGAALSLKAPQLPIYWGIQLSLYNHYFGLGITGDYYVFDRPLVRDINLGWYLGVGGFFGFGHYSEKRSIAGIKYQASWTSLNVGVRVPVGLSWQPLKWLEVYTGIAPGLGLGFYVAGEDDGGSAKSGAYFHWAFDVELGVRFWL